MRGGQSVKLSLDEVLLNIYQCLSYQLILSCIWSHIYCRPMIRSAVKWAVEKGSAFVRKNAIHGLDEYRLPMKEKFKFSNRERTTQQLEAAGEVENGHVGFTGSNAYVNPGALLGGIHGGICCSCAYLTNFCEQSMCSCFLYTVWDFPRRVDTSNAGINMINNLGAGGSKDKLVLPVLQQGQDPLGAKEAWCCCHAHTCTVFAVVLCLSFLSRPSPNLHRDCWPQARQG